MLGMYDLSTRISSFKVHPALNAVPELSQFMESLAERGRAALLPAYPCDCVHNRCARTRVEGQDVAAPQFELQRGGPLRGGRLHTEPSVAPEAEQEDGALIVAMVNVPRKLAVGRRVANGSEGEGDRFGSCLLYTSPSPRDATLSRMPSSA